MRRDTKKKSTIVHTLTPGSTQSTGGLRVRGSPTRSMPSSRKGKGAGPSPLSRGGRSTAGGRTRSSSRLRGGVSNEAASEAHVEDTTTAEVTAGNALIALFGRSRSEESEPAVQAQPQHSAGGGTSRPKRGCAPPPGRWSPAAAKTKGRSSSSGDIGGEARTSVPGGVRQRRVLGQPRAVSEGSPGRAESDARGSSSRAGPATPPEARGSETTASTPKRAGGGGATSSATAAVRRSPRREQAQPQNTNRGRPPKAPKAGGGARSAARSAKSTSAGRRVSTASKGGVKHTAWEKEKMAVLRAVESLREEDCQFAFENPGFKQINDKGWDMWKKHIFTDVVARLRNDDWYPYTHDVLEDKFFNPRNFTRIKKWLDDQKSQLRKEKASLNTSGAPAKARARPTELQALRDAAFGRSKQMTFGINTVESCVGVPTPPPRTTESHETNDPGARASAGGSAAGRGSSVDLSSPGDTAGADGDGGGGRRRKGKGKARESSAAGAGDAEGQEEVDPFHNADIGGVPDLDDISEKSDAENSELSGGEAEAGFSQASPVASPSTPSDNTRSKRTGTPQRDRGRKKKGKNFKSKSATDLFRDGREQSREHNAQQMQQMQGLASGIEKAISNMNSGSGGGGSGGGGSGAVDPIALRRVELDEKYANVEVLRMMLLMKEQQVGNSLSKEDFDEALAACKPMGT